MGGTYRQTYDFGELERWMQELLGHEVCNPCGPASVLVWINMPQLNNHGHEQARAMGEQHALLVVEDVPLVRMLVADYLRGCGMRVIEAANSDEAILILQSDVAVDAVFADVNMPGYQDGFSLAQWVRKNRPDMKMILGSGVAGVTDKAAALGHEGPIIAKPYDLIEVERRLRAVLGPR